MCGKKIRTIYSRTGPPAVVNILVFPGLEPGSQGGGGDGEVEGGGTDRRRGGGGSL